jgi:predicted acyltransferase
MTAARRLESLDAFRGLAVAGMILVNNPGSWDAVPPLLLHADWNGCTIADLVFPAFIFIVGAAMPFAFSRRLTAGTRAALDRRIWGRGARLVALGLVLNLVAVAPDLAHVRFPGVLQRIGVVYVAAAFVVLHTDAVARLALAAASFLGHWALLTLIPFGGRAAGIVTPHHNLASLLDRAVFGLHTLTPAGDPEGLLGTIPAIGTALLGSIAGEWIARTSQPARDPGGTPKGSWIDATVRGAAGLAAGGAAAAIIGLAWARIWPLNKPLWTGSYALFTAGIAALILALCYLLIDVRGFRRWARPLVWLGVNPLAIYFLAELTGHVLDRPWVPDGVEWTTAKSWMFWEILQPHLEPLLSDTGISVAFAALTVAVWTAVAGVLHRRGIRVQV